MVELSITARASLASVAFKCDSAGGIQYHLSGVFARHALSKSNHEETVKHVQKVGYSVERLARTHMNIRGG